MPESFSFYSFFDDDFKIILRCKFIFEYKIDSAKTKSKKGEKIKILFALISVFLVTDAVRSPSMNGLMASSLAQFLSNVDEILTCVSVS